MNLRKVPFWALITLAMPRFNGAAGMNLRKVDRTDAPNEFWGGFNGAAGMNLRKVDPQRAWAIFSQALQWGRRNEPAEGMASSASS